MDVVLCARGGSSRVKRKNIRDLGGKPLISHSIEFAKKFHFVGEIHVNSDDDEILSIAKDYNCSHYKRPGNLGSGNVFVVDVIREMIMKKGIEERNFIVMFPTVPLRRVEDFEAGYQLFQEMNFLKHLGYGLNINKCCVTGEFNNTYFISPKTGNAVNFEVGKKYAKNLFKIPICMKENFKKNKYNDYKEALKITGYFFLKILENNKFKFIFRNQIINKLEGL